MTQEKPRNKKLIQIIVGAVVIALYVLLFVEGSDVGEVKVESSVAKNHFQSISDDFNKQAPFEMDEFLVIERTATDGESYFSFDFKFKNMVKSEVDIESFNEVFAENFTISTKEDPKMKPLRDDGLVLELNCYDGSGEFITKISITPEMYK